MPSANWREVADNWFGACCCSFGGISEKLVTRYVNAHTCTPGICLLSSTSATVCKDDLVECNFPEVCQHQDYSYVTDNPGGDGVDQGTENFGLNGERTSTCSDAGEVNCAFDENSRNVHPEENGKLSVDIGLNEEKNPSSSNGGEANCAFDENSKNPHHENGKLSANIRYEIAQCDDFPGTHPDSNDTTKDSTNIPNCCAHTASASREDDDKLLLFGNARKTETLEILGNQKSFLNGFLEDIFMARSSNLSKDIEWHEFTCPDCTGLLGAYPCCEGSAPVDGGVRLYKCYISTCLPVLGSGDIFRSAKSNKIPLPLSY